MRGTCGLIFTCDILYRNGLTASAVCAFEKEDLDETFSGPYKWQANDRSNWESLDANDVPMPRPGEVSFYFNW